MTWIYGLFIIVSFVITLITLFQESFATEESEKDNVGLNVGLFLLSTAFLISFLGMAVLDFIVTRSDPTDPTVKYERDLADYDSHALAAEVDDILTKTAEFYCNICETHVIVGSNHCRICNRCCADFDHHCRWVSNDIGVANYVEFMRLLLFTIATLFFGAVLSLITIVRTHEFADLDHVLLNEKELLILNYATLALNVITMIFLIYLTSFHGHLIRRGITTMKYL